MRRLWQHRGNRTAPFASRYAPRAQRRSRLPASVGQALAREHRLEIRWQLIAGAEQRTVPVEHSKHRRRGRGIVVALPEPFRGQFKIRGRGTAGGAHRAHQVELRAAVAAQTEAQQRLPGTERQLIGADDRHRALDFAGTGNYHATEDIGTQGTCTQQRAACARVTASNGLHHQFAGGESGVQFPRVTATERRHGIHGLVLVRLAEGVHREQRNDQQQYAREQRHGDAEAAAHRE